jgi:hypothetical protein
MANLVIIYGHKTNGEAIVIDPSQEAGLRAKRGAELDAFFNRYVHEGPLKLLHAEKPSYWTDGTTVFIARPGQAAAPRPPPPNLGDIELDGPSLILTDNPPLPPKEWDLHPDTYAADHLFDHLQTFPNSERWLLGCVAEGTPTQLIIVVGTQDGLPDRKMLPFMWLDIPVAQKMRLGGRGWHTAGDPR